MRTTKWLGVALISASGITAAACGGELETNGSGGGGGGEGGSTTTTSTTTTTTTTTTSSGGGQGGEGGAQQIVTATEDCPGGLGTLSQGESLTVEGTTTGAEDDHDEFCADDGTDGSSAPDVVVQLDLEEACTLTLALDDAGSFDGALSIRDENTCAMRQGGAFACIDQATNGELYLAHFDAGTYHVVIDGESATSGDFSLEVTCDAPVCGDGVVNPGEQCDAGGAVPNDGCGDPAADNACQLEAQEAGEACADATAVAIAANEAICMPSEGGPYTNANANDDFAGSCLDSPTGGPDNVFAVTPAVSGLLEVSVGRDCEGDLECVNGDTGNCWAHAVYVREATCTDPDSEVMCAYWAQTADVVSESSFAVTGGTTYYVIVDSDYYDSTDDTTFGTYHLNLELTPN